MTGRPISEGETQQGPRKEFLYWTDQGGLAALRYNQWKVLFKVQRAHGFDVWQEPFVTLRVPLLVDLHADPFERAEYEGGDYAHWRFDRRLFAGSRAGICRPVVAVFQAVPTAPDAGELQPGPGHAKTQRSSKWRQLGLG